MDEPAAQIALPSTALSLEDMSMLSSLPQDDLCTPTARPYPHQVGGHGQLAVTKAGRVLKPLTAKEHAFYTYISSDQLPEELIWLRHNTPKYFGDTQSPKFDDPDPDKHPHRPRPRFDIRPTPDYSINLSNNSAEHSPYNNHNLRWRTHGDEQTSLSPWATQVRARRSSLSASRKATLSIALEDINGGFDRPCVMDCKIGRRHFDDDASDEKKRRHIAKAKATTTAKCGVRYTGMQSYKRNGAPISSPGVFESRNKYHGRTLKEHDLVPEATWFFHDSHVLRTDCVRRIRDKIINLRRHLDKQRHFYFYSSSLLLVYEGALPASNPPKVDVRMIDFAHTVRSQGNRDDGYLFGIDYLIHILTTILENEESGLTKLPLEPDPSRSLEVDIVGDISRIDPNEFDQ